MTFFVNIWLNVSSVVSFVWFIVKISFVKKGPVLTTSTTILLAVIFFSIAWLLLNSFLLMSCCNLGTA